MLLKMTKDECNLTLDKPEDKEKYELCRSTAVKSSKECIQTLYKIEENKSSGAQFLITASAFTITAALIF